MSYYWPTVEHTTSLVDHIVVMSFHSSERPETMFTNDKFESHTHRHTEANSTSVGRLLVRTTTLLLSAGTKGCNEGVDTEGDSNFVCDTGELVKPNSMNSSLCRWANFAPLPLL